MIVRSKLWTRGFLCLVTLAAVAALGDAVRRSLSSHPGGPGFGEGSGAVVRTVALQQPLPPDILDGGVAWLNTGGPIRLKDLRGKIVILDFWTYCCINCHHVLPVLARIEEKYKNEVVVIGVHTPKFPAEHDTDNIRHKIREYNIKHPVINDANQTLWNSFGVNSWPTLVVIGPHGEGLDKQGGEVPFEALDQFIGKAVNEFKGDLNLTPVKFFPENEKPDNTPLLFPGKVLADAPGRRLFIADTGHNRLVMTDLDGTNPVLIGSGSTGLTDGPFDRAEFHRPQGMALVGETLYVADTENHAIRAVDLKAKTVATIAGTGEQSHAIARPGTSAPGRKAALNSPWDLAHVAKSRVLYIAMAGPHQIWHLDLETGHVGPWAGTGVENIFDGPIGAAAFAQPSGLATDGQHLFVADSEVSALRSITLGGGRHLVHSIVGEGLFEFGDVDGRGPQVRLQHCLGVAYGDGKLYVADTYNNKVKVCDPGTRAVKTLAGTGKPGDSDSAPSFYQPGGLSVAGSKLYVADTNNHKVRVVDLGDRSVRTLELGDLSPPAPRVRRPTFPNATAIMAKKVEVAPTTRTLTLDLTLPIKEGFKLNAEGAMPVLVEVPGKTGFLAATEDGKRVEPPAKSFTVDVKFARELKKGESFDLKVSAAAFECSEGSSLCMIRSYVWTVPVTVAGDGKAEVVVEEDPAKRATAPAR